MSKVGDQCPYCNGCSLKSFRIDVDAWIVKCESSKCMYPIAVTKEQCPTCRDKVSENDILDDFLGEILSDSPFDESSEILTNFDTIDSDNLSLETQPTQLTYHTLTPESSVIFDTLSEGLTESVAPLEQISATLYTTVPSDTTTSLLVQNVPSTSLLQNTTSLPVQNATPSEPQATEPPKISPPGKITRSIKQLEITRALSAGSSSADSPVKKIKTGKIIRRLIKLEPSGSAEPREVIQSVTHMKPLDYVKYFMDQNRMS